MSKFENPRANKASEIFEVNKQLKEVYITADLQGFTDKDKAADRTRYLNDKEVEHFVKGFEKTYTEDAPKEPKEPKQPEDQTEREKLFAEYEQLFGKKASHNIGTDKLKKQVEDKRKENAQP